MRRFTLRFARLLVLALLIALGAGLLDTPLAPSSPSARAQTPQVSEFGHYAGYSVHQYNAWVQTTEYLTMRDGVRIAVDIVRPTQDGKPVEDPLPVVWFHTRYWRQGYMGVSHRLVPYGYIVAGADARGTGDSEGLRVVDYTPLEAQDAYEITEWLGSQPWSNGKVGMIGGSYLGTTQMWAASQAPPSLKAIFPQVHLFDQYVDTGYQNGILMLAGVRWADRQRERDDQTGQSTDMLGLLENMIDPSVRSFPYRDSIVDESLAPLIAPLIGYEPAMGPLGPHTLLSPHYYLDEINSSGVAVYQLGGWLDCYPGSELRWFANLAVPQKLVMTPWDHQGYADWVAVEQLRWFDYWLKDIDNGIMDEPPLRYAVVNAPQSDTWRTADTWPRPEEQRWRAYFQAGPTGSGDSVNDGALAFEPPPASATADPEQDDYTVNYQTSLGRDNRFAVTMEGRRNVRYPADLLIEHNAQALTYTTPPLDADLEVTGHPVAHLWVTSTAEDGDFFVYLEEIVDGHPIYVTEGRLRASHRALHTPPYENFGLPWHGSYEADLAPLTPGEPVELVFELLPTSYIFREGSRLRVVVAGADVYGFETPVLEPAPTVTVFRNAAHASYIDLPVIPASDTPAD